MSARSLLIALALLATGCATNGDPRDPLEGLNRGVQAFNDVVDENALQPAARLYRNVTPSGFRDGVRNFFNNLDDLYIGANNLLQGKVEQAMGDLMRVAVNTTLGFFGVIGWASDMGLEEHNEGFGQPVALWGGERHFTWPALTKVAGEMRLPKR